MRYPIFKLCILTREENRNVQLFNSSEMLSVGFIISDKDQVHIAYFQIAFFTFPITSPPT